MRCWQSIPHLFRLSSSCYLLILLLSLIWNILPTSGLDCAKAKRDWLTYRYKVMVTGVVASSYNQPVCLIPEGNSCCDKQMEMDIFAVGERELSTSLASWLIPVVEQMESDSVALDYFFRSDLTEARNRLHEAFSGIYGYNYKVNHAFFFQFFNDLEAYMAGRRGDLGQLVTSFFAQLRTSIVVLMEKAEGTASGGMNSAPATGGDAPPDTQRINCLSEALGKQNAFDLTDVHLKEQFLQVYPPARMLVNSLAATAKLLRTVVEDASTRPECIVAFARFRYCGTYCGGREGSQAEICPAACDNFMKACFADAMPSNPSSSLPSVWSQLINGITTTTKRLERTQNFASVNKDLHIFLSEAITYVHQKYASVKSSLLQECKYSGGSGSSTSNSAGGYKPSGNSWPFSQRLRRSLDNSTLDDEPILLRAKRQGSYPGAAWQQPDLQSAWGVPPTPLGGSNNQKSPSQSSHSPSSYQFYFQPSRRASGGGGSVGGGNAASVTNAPEKLSKWATQLKFYYSGVQELFDRASQNVCPATTVPNAACWNPQPVSPSSQSKRYTGIISDLHTLTSRLETMNSRNNGDPEAFELGARMLAEVKMRNATSSAPSSSHGGPSLLQPMGPSPAGQMYGQPPMRSHDLWRTGGGAAMNNYGASQPMMQLPPMAGNNDGGYAPGANYQMPPGSQGGGSDMIPNHVDMDAAESGYDSAGGPPAPGTPSLLPQQPPQYPGGFPLQPPQSPSRQPPGYPPQVPSSVKPIQPNQPWGVPPPINGGADTEGSGFGEPAPGPVPPSQPGGGGNNVPWGQGGTPWGQQPGPVPPLSQSNPWESQPVKPVQQPQPSPPEVWQPSPLNPDQQQGSGDGGDGVLPGPEAFPPLVEIASTTTTTTASTALPTTTTATTTTRRPTTTTTTTTTTAAPRLERVNASLPLPPTQPMGGFDDDEDFGIRTPVPPSRQLPSQVPWSLQSPQQPGQQQFGQEVGGYFPDSSSQGTINQGEVQPLELPPPQQGQGLGQGHELPPPDCSPEAMASAGSGVDPRCLPGGVPPGLMPYPGQPGVVPQQPQQPVFSAPRVGEIDLEGEEEGGQDKGSGMSPDDVLEPPPPPPPHQGPQPGYIGYPGAGETSHEQQRPDFHGLPGYDGLVPPHTPDTPRPPSIDIDRSHQPPQTKKPPSISKPQKPLPPPRELPPDIWLPVPELKPGDPRLPDSKLFLPDFPPHRGRPMVGERSNSGFSDGINASLLAVITTLVINAVLRG